MSSLEEFIISETNFTRGELQQALFAHPGHATIEAVRRKMGRTASDELLAVVAGKLGFKVLEPATIIINKQLIEEGGEELQRLMYCFKSVPLYLVGSETGSSVRLAMTDPFDEDAERAFATFFNSEIIIQCAHESELFVALDAVIRSCGPEYDFREKYRTSKRFALKSEVPRDIQASIEKVIVEAIGYSASEIEFEFRDSTTRAIIGLSLDRDRPVDLPVTSESFVGAIVANSAIDSSKDTRFDGICELSVKGVGVSGKISFHDFHKNRNGGEGKALILSELKLQPRETANLWKSKPSESVTKLLEVFDKEYGLYVGGVPDTTTGSYLCSAFQRRHRGVHVVYGLDSLAKETLLAKQLRHSRVLVLEPTGGLPELLDKLNRFPVHSRSVIRSVFALSQLPRICYFCKEETNVTPASRDLFPEQLRTSVKTLIYPRSCGVCAETGYCGTVDLLAVMPMDSDAGRAFLQGTTSAEIKKLLRPSGVQTTLETGLQAVLAGQSTIEMLYQSLLKRQDFTKQQLLTVGREILRDGKVLASGAEKFTSPLGSPEKKKKGTMTDFHSVILQLGDDVMAMREALAGEDDDDKDGGW